MPRHVQKVSTSGNNANCLVNALATFFMVLRHTGVDSQSHYVYEQTYLNQKLSRGAFDNLKKIYKDVEGHNNDDIFGLELPNLDPAAQILRLGRALRQYGSSLMMNDVRGDRLYSETLEQALLVAFEEYCHNRNDKVKDAFDKINDDTFAGMSFVKQKFESLYTGGPLSEEATEQKKQALGKWWCAPYTDTKAKNQAKSIGGYQLYVMELAKDGVQLSPQLGSIITGSLGFNLVYDTEIKQQYGKLVYASNKFDGPCVLLHRDGNASHWELYLDPAQIEIFNQKLMNNVEPLLQVGASIRDTTHFDFLTAEQYKEFENKLAKDKNEDDANIKFGRALAACYKINDENRFAEDYQAQILDGEGMLTAVASSIAMRYHSNAEPENHVLNIDDFVEGFCKAAACSDSVSRYNLLEFAKAYARFKIDCKEHEDVKNGERTSQQIAEQAALDWAGKQNEKWRVTVQSEIRNIISNDHLKKQVDVDRVRVVSPVQVSADEIVVELPFKNGLVLQRSQGATGQLEVSTKGATGKNATSEQCYELIANVIILDRCHKFGKTREELTQEELTIMLDLINPPDKVEECRKAFLKANLKVLFTSPVDPAAHSKESSEKASTENLQPCRSEEPSMQQPSAPPLGMAR